MLIRENCDLARIQTWNLLSRNQVLYSIELRSHFFLTEGKGKQYRLYYKETCPGKN